MRRATYLVVYLMLVVAVALAFGSGTVRLGDDRLETSVTWGGRVLDSRQELSSWLAARGTTYEEWARKHPDAAARIELRGSSIHVALQWPPAVHGQMPAVPTAVLGACAAIVVLAAAAFAGRRRIARGIERARTPVAAPRGLAAVAFPEWMSAPLEKALYTVVGAITAIAAGILIAAAFNG
jgi:hypothetical protein